MSDTSHAASGFSIVRGDPLFRLQRTLKLVTDDRMFTLRRAILGALLAWVPMAAWVLLVADEGARQGGESFFRHFGVHARCLIALPLMIVNESRADRIIGRVVGQFTAAGLVPDGERAGFDRVMHAMARLRSAWWIWLLILGLVIASVVAGVAQIRERHDVVWAIRADGSVGFGAWWFILVARPLGMLLGVVWLWRVAVTALLLWRLTRLNLYLVPAHPDRAAGLGFVELAIAVFAPIVLAISAAASAREAHFVLEHGVALASLKLQAMGFVLFVLVVFLSPLFAVAPALRAVRRRAYFDYAALVSRTDAEFERRVQERRVAAGELLDRSDYSAMADAATVFATAANIRAIPISRVSILAVLIPALIPLLLLVSTQIPLREILAQVASAVL
jgi:hypothetical protein